MVRLTCLKDGENAASAIAETNRQLLEDDMVGNDPFATLDEEDDE